MRVKVGDRWFDGSEAPICIQLTVAEQDQVCRNGGKNRKYAQFPDGWGSEDEMRAWISEPGDV